MSETVILTALWARPRKCGGTDTLMHASIGTEIETGRVIGIGDMERRTGLYILGRSGMGKSWLMVNLILQDIENGHGVLFLDPHAKGIDELVERLLSSGHSLDNVVLLDPEHKRGSFGINLLSCTDIDDINERVDTYTRAKGVFDKIWRNAYYELPWLQMILEFVIYTFIENPDCTLSEVPLFLTDKEFRDYIVGNIKFHRQSIEFWQRRFHPKQAEAALARVDTLLGHPYVNHIVSQRQTTIDFNRLIAEKRIVLLRLSDKLPTELKTFIGTILISELVFSVKKRSTHNPDQFCVFVDEFQNFASYEDFSNLITGGRKYGIATTIAHQERFGQFPDNKVILGATDAAGNKVIFQTSDRDGQELAPEFYRKPPEPALVISQEPVFDLLRGHENAHIREFVNRYLRPIQEQLQDARDDMEGERLIRTDYLDEAALHRVDERVDWLRQRGRGSEAILGRVQSSIEQARQQTSKMYSLFETSKNLRQSPRDINRLFTALMEGRASCSGEEFSQFLIERVRGSTLVPEDYIKVLELYISFVYGSADTPRIIPQSLALACGAWRQAEVKALIEDKHFSDRVGAYEESAGEREARSEQKFKAEREAVLREMKTYKTWTFGADMAADHAFWTCLLIWRYPAVLNLLEPFVSCRFKPPWKEVCPEDKYSFWVEGNYRYGDFIDEAISWLDRRFRPSYLTIKVKEKFLKVAGSFLRHNGQGAIVASCLIYSALYLRNGHGSTPRESRHYKTMQMMEVPAIEGYEPLQILLFLKKLNEVLFRTRWRFGTDFAKAYEFKYSEINERDFKEMIARNFGLTCIKMEPWMLYEVRREFARINERGEEREDAVLLIGELHKNQAKWFDHKLSGFWEEIDEFTRTYLIMRACDLVRYGERVAKFTYPQPEIRVADEAFVARVVEVLVTALEQASAEKRQAKAEKWRRGVEESVRGELITLDHDKVTELLPRRLTGSEIQSLKAACWNEISRCQPVFEMVRVIEKFGEFCELLARPENHIMVPSKQRVVNTRTVADMTNEMAGELANLPRYTAYAKVLAETGGEQTVLRTKIRTLKLKELPEGEVAEVARQAGRAAIEQNSLRYLKSRVAIEEEIRLRHEKWRQRTREVPPPVQRRVEKGEAEPPGAGVKEADVPPHPTQSPVGGESDEPPPIHG